MTTNFDLNPFSPFPFLFHLLLLGVPLSLIVILRFLKNKIGLGSYSKSFEICEGRVAVVTGANKGIGYHTALQLAESGLFSHVILGCRNEERGRKAEKELQSKLSPGSKAIIKYYPLTVGNENSHRDFRNQLEKDFGKLDVLINNAAIAFKLDDHHSFADQAKPTIDINFRGTTNLTDELLPLIQRGTDPRIVIVASLAGWLGQLRSQALKEEFTAPDLTIPKIHKLVDNFEKDVQNGIHAENGWGDSNYGLTKLALIASSMVYAREQKGIKVNACCTGYCDTDMTSHKGTRPPEKGASCVSMLAINPCTTGKYYQDWAEHEWKTY